MYKKRGFGMKKHISATVDKETEKILDSLVKKFNYRNKSHVIEDAIKALAEKKEKNDKK